MRLPKPKADFLKKAITRYLPYATVYLFGSRTKDDQRGGDIDILIIGDRKLTGQEKRNIKISFYKQFGEQKIDLVSYTNTDDANFKKIALMESIKL